MNMRCDDEYCRAEGFPVYESKEDERNHNVSLWLCDRHAVELGYCAVCGIWTGEDQLMPDGECFDCKVLVADVNTA